MTGNLREVWAALHFWKIPGPDKTWTNATHAARDEAQAAAGVHALERVVAQFLAALVAYLELPRYRRARHVTFGINRIADWVGGGKAEAEALAAVTHEQNLLALTGIHSIQRFVQDLKMRGLDGGQTHRLDQYVSKVAIAFDHLAYLKEYRTPQLFRAFARLFPLAMPIVYAPHFCALAQEAGGPVGLAIFFSCTLQLAISALLEVMLGLEDPFAGAAARPHAWSLSTRYLDSIDIREHVELLRRQLVRIRREAEMPLGSLAVREAW